MADAVQTMGAVFGLTVGFPGSGIINLTDVSRSGTSGGIMETTNLSSTSGFKTYLTSGVFEQGEVSIAFNYDPSAATHTALVTAWQAGTAESYTMRFGDGVDTYVALLIPMSFDWTNTLADDGKLEATVTFKHAGSGITEPS